MTNHRDYGKSDELERALQMALDRADSVGSSYLRYSEILRLRQQLDAAIDYVMSEKIDNLDVD